jgi:hypothetical protein
MADANASSGGTQNNDVSPWNGANGIKVMEAYPSDMYGECASWFNLTNGTFDYGVTNAHCSDGYNDGTGTSTYPVETLNSGFVGHYMSPSIGWLSRWSSTTFPNPDGGNSNVDMATFGYDPGTTGVATSSIWARNGTITERRVVGPLSAGTTLGLQVCNSNHIYGENCGITVSYVNADFAVVGYPNGQLDQSCTTGGPNLWGVKGASGSPMYLASVSSTGSIPTAEGVGQHHTYSTDGTSNIGCFSPISANLGFAGSAQYGPVDGPMYLKDAPMVPNTPANPAAALDDSGGLTITWPAPFDGGRAISNYTIQYADAATRDVNGNYPSWALLATTGSGLNVKTMTRAQYSGILTSDKAYVFRVQASNVIGSSLWSLPSSSTNTLWIGKDQLVDHFNRAVAGGGLGNAETGQPWVNYNGATSGVTPHVGISGGQVVAVGGSSFGDGTFADVGTDTWDATFTYNGANAPTTGDFHFAWRGPDPSNTQYGGFWHVEPHDRRNTNNGFWSVKIFDRNGLEVLYKSTVPVATGDRIKVSNHPYWFTVYVNGQRAVHIETTSQAKVSNNLGFSQGPTLNPPYSFDDLIVTKSSHPGSDVGYAYDHFDRADTTTGLGTSPTGTAWTAGAANDLNYFKISGNQVQGIWDNNPYALLVGHKALLNVGSRNDERISVQQQGFNQTEGKWALVGKYVDANNYWILFHQFNATLERTYLRKYVNGVQSGWQVSNFGPTAGQYVTLTFKNSQACVGLNNASSWCSPTDSFANNGGQYAGFFVGSSPTSTGGTPGWDKLFVESVEPVTGGINGG